MCVRSAEARWPSWLNCHSSFIQKSYFTVTPDNKISSSLSCHSASYWLSLIMLGKLYLHNMPMCCYQLLPLLCALVWDRASRGVQDTAVPFLLEFCILDVHTATIQQRTEVWCFWSDGVKWQAKNAKWLRSLACWHSSVGANNPVMRAVRQESDMPGSTLLPKIQSNLQ